MSVAQRAFEQQALGVPIAWVLSCPPRLPTFELSFPRAFECSGGELYVLAQFPTHSRGMSSPERHYRVRSQQMDPFFSTHYKQLPPRPPGASLGRSRRVEQDTQILSSKDAMNYEAYLTPGSPLLRVSPRMREAHRHRLISRRLAEEKKPHQDIGVSCRLSYYQHLAEEAPEHVRQGMVGTKTAKGVCQETKCADVSEALCKQTGPSIMTEMAVRISKGSSGHLHGHEKDQSELSLCDEISQGVLDVCTTTSGERLPDSVNNQASSTCPEGSLHGNLDLHQKLVKFQMTSKAVSEDFDALSKEMCHLESRLKKVIENANKTSATMPSEIGRPIGNRDLSGTERRLRLARSNYMATTSSKTIPKDSSDRALRSRGAAFTSTSMSMEPGQHGFVLPEYRRLGIPKPRIDQNEKETREVSASAARNGSVRGRKTAHNFQVDHEEAAGLSQPGRSCSDANNHRLSRQQITEKLLPTQSSGLCHGQLYREASDKPMDMSAEIMLQNWGNRSSLPAKNNMSVVVSQEGTPSRMMTGKKCPAKLGQPSSKNGYMENISIAPGSDLLPEPSGPIAVSTAVASNTSGGCTHEPEAALSTCQREILPPCSSAVESRMRPDGWLLSTSCVGMSKTVGNMTPGLDGSHCRSARQETESASWSFLGSTLPVSTGNGKRHLSTFECRDHTTGCLCSELKPYQSETSQSPLPGMPLSQAHAVPPMRHAKTAADGWTEVISSNPQGGGCVSGFAFQGMYTRKGGVSSLQPRNALSPSGLPAEGEGGIRSWEFWRSGSWQGASCGGRDSVCASCQQLHQGDTKRALTPAFSAQSEPAHGAPVWPDSAGKGDNMPTPRSDAREPGGQVHTRVSQASDASEALTVPLSANPDHIALGRLSIGPHGRHVQTATRTVAASPSESQAFRQLSQGLADYKVTGFDRSSMREKGINAVNGLAHGAGSDQRNRVRASSNGPAGGAAAKISGSMYAGPEYACTEESCPPSRPGAFPSTAGAGNGNLAEISSRGLDSRTQLVSEANELEEHRILIDRGRALAEAVRDATQQALAPSPPSTPQKRLDFRFISPFESRVILGSASCSEAAASAAGIPPAGGGMMRPVHMMPPSASHERFPLASADMDVAEIISHASHVRLSESLSPYQPRESPYSLQQVEPLDLGEPVSDHREREAVRRQLEPDLYTPPPQTRGSNRLIQIPTPSTLQYSNAQKRPCSTTTPLIALPKSAISCGGFNCKEMATVLASQTSRCTPSTSVANTDSLSLPLVAYVPKQTSSAFSAALPTSPSPRMASSQRSLSSTPGPTVTELPIASLHSLDPLPRACKIPHEGAGKPVPNSVGPVAALVPYDFRSRQDAQSCARESETSGARHVDEDLEVPNKKMMPVVELHHRMGGQTNLKPYVSRAPQILLRGPETCSKGVESDGCAMEQLHDKTSMPEEVPSRLFDPATMICPSEQFPLQRTELGASSARQLHEDLRTAEEQPKPVLPDSSQPTLLVPYCSPPNQLALQTHGSMAHRNGQGSNAVPRACLPIESWQRGKEQAQPGSQQMDESSIAQDPDSSLHVHLHLNGGSAPWMVPPHRFSCSSSAAADSSSDGSQAAAADLETATGSQVSHNSEPSFPSSIAGDVSRLLWRLGGIID